MRSSLVILAAILLALLLNAATRTQEERSDRLIIDRVHLVDPLTGAVTRNQALVIEAGRIARIAPSGEVSELGPRVDGAGRYVTPGLWDSHVHALGDVEDALDRVLPLFVAYGVTHVRDMASNLDRLQAVRERIAEDPGQIAPQILAAGPLLIEQEVRWYGDIQRAVGEAGSAEAVVSELAEAGVDFIKAYTGLSAPSYAALIKAAETQGLAVDGHVPDSMGLIGVIDAGQRTIEHLDISAFLSCAGGPEGPFGDHLAVRFTVGMEAHMRGLADFMDAFDWESCGPALERFGARGGALTPTLSMEMRERALIPDGALDRLSAGSRDWCMQGLEEIDAVPAPVRQQAYDALARTLMRLKAAGVTMLAGTDAPNHCIIAGLGLSAELERLSEAGLSPLEVLRAATVNPARTFGERSGVEAGAPADLVLLDVNPLEDVTAYRAPSGVYTQGRWFDEAALEMLREAGRVDQEG